MRADSLVADFEHFLFAEASNSKSVFARGTPISNRLVAVPAYLKRAIRRSAFQWRDDANTFLVGNGCG